MLRENSEGAPVSFESWATGVAQNFWACAARFGFPRLWLPSTVGVGQDEESLPFVRGPDIRSAQSARRNSESEALKVRRDHVQSGSDGSPDVFPENESRPCLAYDSEHFPPKSASSTTEAGALSCNGKVLTGASANDAIHDAAKRSAVEGGHVVPDRSRHQGRFFHPGHEDARGKCSPLDVHHRPGAGCEGDAEPEASIAREELDHSGR